MTNLDVSNSSTDSSSGSTSDSSSSGSSSTSSGSGSSSSDSESSTSDTPAVAQPAPKSPAKPDEEPPKKKDDPKPRQANKKISSSSDDEAPKPEPPKPAPPRRRSSTKTKSAASVLVKNKPTRTTAGAKPPKPIPKTMTKQQPKNDQTKKKSIFSPDNSSESESESKSSKSKSPKSSPKNKRPVRKSSEEKDVSPPSPVTPVENDDSNSKDTIKRRSGSRPNGPPSKKVVENKSASSCSSSQSSAETVSSESDSEPTPKKQPLKTGKTKPPSTTTKPEKGKSDSGDSQMNNMPRKLTRSLSARVSRMATATRPRTTDTDSDTEEKSNDKSKEVKKKGRATIARSPVAELAPPEPSERRCPVRGCDSTGHLGGKLARHFTWDACPIYHNLTGAWCVAAAEERAAAAAARRRAVAILQQRPRAMPTIEQRAYQLKVKDMRSKWKGSQELREKLAACGGDDMNEEREPILEGFAPDYDLRLFREAQALAAIKIEQELGDISTNKGTRFVVMGKYMMEVWYQSPYPGDAARVPRLFVCEFCLNHHKSAAGAARHRHKCVWRHPPGDEVYRKDKLSVWQVDGRKHKQYCQQLCLLAKFFLDHKTLYYDVEPFLFHVYRKDKLSVWQVDGRKHKQYCQQLCLLAKFFLDHKTLYYDVEPFLFHVYRKDKLSVWQVDGRKHKQYCQQLCLLAKFFLDHKTLYYDVEPFLFYVMTCADEEGCHVVGYFSKEKNSFLNYNVSCILTLPPYQRQGYGRLLIDFSYLLTKVEGKVGSPETPLSDLGLISYRSYWKEALLKRLCSAPGPTLCIRDLSKDLAIASSDIVSTLQERGLMKYWKGKHIVLKKQDVLEEVSRRASRARCVEASCLRWTPPGAPPPR